MSAENSKRRHAAVLAGRDDAENSKRRHAAVLVGRDPIEHDPEIRLIAERVLSLQSDTQWDLPARDGRALHGAELEAWLLAKENQAAKSKLERGIGYQLKKRELGHGAFEGWIEDHGLSKRAVRECMQVARLVLGLSEPNAKRASLLPQHKLAVLASAPTPLIEDLFANGALDEAEQMRRAELRELVKAHKELERMAEREERLNATIAEQHEALRRHEALPETQKYLLELRRAVLDETAALRANAATLQALLDRVALLPGDLPAHEADAVAHPLMWALQGLHATSGALFARGFEQFSGYQVDVSVMPPELPPEEAAILREREQDFLGTARLRAAHREADIGIEHKRGRGRPRKERAR